MSTARSAVISSHHPVPSSNPQPPVTSGLPVASLIYPVILACVPGREIRAHAQALYGRLGVQTARYWRDEEGVSALTNGMCEATHRSAFWEHANDRFDWASAAAEAPDSKNLQVEAGAMLLFCPSCGNGLIVEEGQRCHRFACNTCPYVHNITRKVSSRGECLLRCPGGTEPAAARSVFPAGGMFLFLFFALAAEVPLVQQLLIQWRRSGQIQAIVLVMTEISASASLLPVL